MRHPVGTDYAHYIPCSFVPHDTYFVLWRAYFDKSLSLTGVFF